MTDGLYVDWCNRHASPLTIVGRGLEYFPSSDKLWLKKIEILGDSSEVTAIFDDAIGYVKGEASCAIWQKYLDWLIGHCNNQLRSASDDETEVDPTGNGIFIEDVEKQFEVGERFPIGF